MEPTSITQALMSPNTYVKPAASAGAIFFIDKFIVQNPNMSNTVTLAAGVGASFLAVKLINPYLPKYQTAEFSTGAIEQRVLEVGVCVGMLAGLKALKVINLPQFQDPRLSGGITEELATLIPIAATILVADIIGEGVLPFFGFSNNIHF
jgi:hypothetical protein